jgi:hypothetical protein
VGLLLDTGARACIRCCTGGDRATFVNSAEVIELAALKDIELDELGDVSTSATGLVTG